MALNAFCKHGSRVCRERDGGTPILVTGHQSLPISKGNT